jgi:RNA polymerase sigma-70 factor (ECF subfamily)
MTNALRPGQSMVVASREVPETRPAGKPVDLRELFAMHAPYVWNTLRRLGVPQPDLEDVTHDVFLQVQRHLGDYDAARPVRPWLFGFAFRVASQHRRKAHRRRETPGLDQAHEAVDPGALPDARIAAEQDRRLVLDALEAIDLDRRAVFVLYEIDGVPMDEIARALGIPVNTAYSRLRVARTEFAAAVKRLRRGER